MVETTGLEIRKREKGEEERKKKRKGGCFGIK
jgi:hypothetical protein